jgi:hypothetical protein
VKNAKDEGLDKVKNRSEQWEGSGGGSSTGALCKFTLVVGKSVDSFHVHEKFAFCKKFERLPTFWS